MAPTLLRSRLAVLALAAALFAGCAPKKNTTQLWEPIALGSDAEFEDVWFADSLNGWIVGGGPEAAGGIVGRTRDGGRTWAYTSGLATPEPGVFRFSLEAVRFLGPNRGVVATDGGKIFVTDDGGENWRLARYGKSSTDHLFDLSFIDERNGWAVGLGGVLRTTDGGETWQTASQSSPYERESSGHAIVMLGPYTGWLVGMQGSVRRTNDGGTTWVPAATPFVPNERPNLNDVCFTDAEHGWIVGEEGTILHTTDGGATWLRQDTGVADAKSKPQLEHIQRRRGVIDTLDLGGRTPALCLTSVRFVDAMHGYVAGHFEPGGGRSLLLSTDDGGATWRIEAEARGEALQALFVLDAAHAWAIGDRVREGTHVVLRRTPDAAASARIKS